MLTFFLIAIAVLTGFLGFLAGRHLRSYLVFLVSIVIGVSMSALSILLSVWLGQLERFGLAVIAIVPVMIVFVSFFNIVSVMLGAALGMFIKKRRE